MLPRLRLPWRRSLVILCVVVAGGVGPIEAQEIQDVVYLRDGSIIRGTIVEQVPSESILIETSDGSRFRYSMELIERMTREQVQGQATPQLTSQSLKSPGTAWALSFLVPGVGQFYNGDGGEGALYLILHILFSGWLAAAVDCTGSACNDTDAGLAALSLVGNWVLAQVDAYQDAKAINAGESLSLNLGAGVQLAPQFSFNATAIPLGNRTQLDVQLLRWSP